VDCLLFSNGLYTIPADHDFLKNLALGMDFLCQKDPRLWIQSQVYLPNRRSVQTFKKILSQRSLGAFLPKIHCLGGDFIDPEDPFIAQENLDVTEYDPQESLDFTTNTTQHPKDSVLKKSSPLKVIPPFIRKGWITRLVLSHTRGQKNPLPLFVALHLSEALLKLLDQVSIDRADFKGLDELVPENFSKHFEITKGFLQLIAQQWPLLLKEHGYQEFYEALYEKTQYFIKKLQQEEKHEHSSRSLKKGYIIVAGSTGTFSGTGMMMEAISRLSNGYVVFCGPTPQEVQDLPETLYNSHPLKGIHQWFSKYSSLERKNDLRLWPFLTKPVSQGARDRRKLFLESYGLHQGIVQEKLTTYSHKALENSPFLGGIKTSFQKALAQETHGDFPGDFKEARVKTSYHTHEKALEDFFMIPCSCLDQEAQVVALIIKKNMMDNPLKTLSCVTGNSVLARLIQCRLDQWNIPWSYSKGICLKDQKIGCFFSLVLRAAQDCFQPLSWMALLKHPFVAKKTDPHLKEKILSLLERSLRGLALASFSDLFQKDLKALHFAYPRFFRKALQIFQKALEPLTTLEAKTYSIGRWIRSHQEVCQNLYDLFHLWNPKTLGLDQQQERDSTHKTLEPHSAINPCHTPLKEHPGESSKTHNTHGYNTLSKEEHYDALESFLEKWKKASPSYPSVNIHDYIFLFQKFLKQEYIYPNNTSIPSVQILGTLESRLLQSDITILAGLNEGSWPRSVHQDPWLNHEMREKLGLSAQDYYMGLSAQDFWCMLSQKHVYLTRSLWEGGNLTLPSRFWTKIEIALEACHLPHPLDNQWVNWAKQLDHYKNPLQSPTPLSKPLVPPMPCPPLKDRPGSCSVTDLNLWIQNPYHFYAKKILKLPILEPLQSTVGPKEFGTLLHAILETILKRSFQEESPEYNFGPKHSWAFYEKVQEEFLEPFKKFPQHYPFWKYRIEKILRWFYAVDEKERPNIKKSFLEIMGKMDIPTNGGSFGVFAKADRLDLLQDGSWSIIDYKTGSIPTKNDVISGKSWQLPLEAILLINGCFPTDPLNKSPITRTQGIQEKKVLIHSLSFWILHGKHHGGEMIQWGQEILKELPHLELFLKDWIAQFHQETTPYWAQKKPSVFHKEYDILSRLGDWQ
jgi:ATP-dependent helicase/nuclease subunit B